MVMYVIVNEWDLMTELEMLRIASVPQGKHAKLHKASFDSGFELALRSVSCITENIAWPKCIHKITGVDS